MSLPNNKVADDESLTQARQLVTELEAGNDEAASSCSTNSRADAIRVWSRNSAH